MLPTQVVQSCNFAETQRIPTNYNNLSIKDLTELNRNQTIIQEELKTLKEICVNIAQTVNELSAKLSQYDIDSGSEITEHNSMIDDAVDYLEVGVEDADD